MMDRWMDGWIKRVIDQQVHYEAKKKKKEQKTNCRVLELGWVYRYSLYNSFNFLSFNFQNVFKWNREVKSCHPWCEFLQSSLPISLGIETRVLVSPYQIPTPTPFLISSPVTPSFSLSLPPVTLASLFLEHTSHIPTPEPLHQLCPPLGHVSSYLWGSPAAPALMCLQCRPASPAPCPVPSFSIALIPS